jgi:hypothetical protein
MVHVPSKQAFCSSYLTKFSIQKLLTNKKSPYLTSSLTFTSITLMAMKYSLFQQTVPYLLGYCGYVLTTFQVIHPSNGISVHQLLNPRRNTIQATMFTEMHAKFILSLHLHCESSKVPLYIFFNFISHSITGCKVTYQAGVNILLHLGSMEVWPCP